MDELLESALPTSVTVGEFPSRVQLPATAGGGGYLESKRSHSYPTMPGTLEPSVKSVFSYTQLELLVTTYGKFCEPFSSLNCTPISVCSGRFKIDSRHRTVVVGPSTGSMLGSL